MTGLMLVPEAELACVATKHGPDSLEAKTLADLRRARAADKQVFVFRIGEFYIVGPMPDARTELALVLANEAAKRMT